MEIDFNVDELNELFFCQLSRYYGLSYVGKMPQLMLEDACDSIKNIPYYQNKMSVTVSVQSYALYSYVSVDVSYSNKKFFFNGCAGGVGVGGGASLGVMYLVDGVSVDFFIENSTSFEINNLTGFLSVNFFDSHGSVLGHMISGGVVVGGFSGGGRCSWVVR